MKVSVPRATKEVKMTQKVAVTYISYDGLKGIYCGVGTLTRDFLYAFHKVKALIEPVCNCNVDFYPATVRYDQRSFGFSSERVNETINEIAKRNYAPLTELLNGDGRTNYGNLTNWHMASVSAAQFIRTLAKKYDRVIAIVLDPPFAGTGYYYFNHFPNEDNTRIVWLAQSSVLVHRDQPFSARHLNRFEWECLPVKTAKTHKNMFVAVGGHYMWEHIVTEYNANPKKTLKLTNGVYFPRLENFRKNPSEIADYLTTRGISTDKSILFAYGRGEHYKGLDIILRAGKTLSSAEYQTVLLIAPYKMSDPIVSEIKEIAEEYNPHAKILWGVDFYTPYILMQWHKTKILAVPSRKEPCGLIPIEARYFNNPHLTLLVSDRGGLPEQVLQGKTGFVTQLDTETVSSCLEQIADLSVAKKAEIANAGYTYVRNHYDIVKNSYNFLKQLIK